MTIELAPAIKLLTELTPGLAGVYLFGSEAEASARLMSDVDIAIFAGRPLARAQVLDLQERVARLLGRDVDLIDLAAADPIIQMQVLSHGRLVGAPDPRAVGFFELRVLRDYRDLKRRRAGIEADIVERGRVYAR
jgi:predicted nucleotidyltransferase